jgi:hypothetical protein
MIQIAKRTVNARRLVDAMDTMDRMDIMEFLAPRDHMD